MRVSRIGVLVFTAFGLMAFVGPREAAAQSGLAVPIQFDFLTPGARSLSMGGAFTGLADDATSAFTNPAGLMQLIGPEISFEGRYRRVASPFLAGGRLSGRPTGIGADTVTGPAFAESIYSAVSPSFVSFAYPTSRFALAAYRHELTNFEQKLDTSGVFQQDAVLGTLRELSLRAERAVTIATYGASVAVRVSDGVSIGAGVALHDFSLTSTFTRFSNPGFYAQPTYASGDRIGAGEQTGDDTAVAGTLGVLWKVHPKLSIGGLVRSGASATFTTTEESFGGRSERAGAFRIPAAVSLGLASRLSDQFLVSAEVTRVAYSALEDDFVAVQTSGTNRPGSFSVPDVTELHVGLEYTAVNLPRTPSIRLGAWLDPNHSVTYTPTAANDVLDERFDAYLNRGADLVHVGFGFGIPFDRRFELNVGGDISSRTRIVSVLSVVRF